jgi:hypothetical protein
MTKEYTVVKLENKYKVISFEENGFVISFGEDEDNRHYQEYLKSLETPVSN